MFQSFQDFTKAGGSAKTTTIQPKQLLAVIVSHMQRLDKQFTLYINGRLPKPMNELLHDAFRVCHLQQPFYTQHCDQRSYRYMQVSKSRIKIDFTLHYRMTREQEKWMLAEMEDVLANITHPHMTDLEKIVAVHDYIVHTYNYELNTNGSPHAVYTFMKEGRGVCMAYALLFEKMMELANIPCYYVVGHADGEGDNGHAWNMVQLDGDWYHIDATWNDLGKTERFNIRYRYFLLSDDAIKGNHTWNLADYPPCTSDRFKPLHRLYDVAIDSTALYYPHPNTALLYKLDLQNKLQAEKLLDVRVQHCMPLDGKLYFSNYSDKGYLYVYDFEAKTSERLREQLITRIERNKTGIAVHFEGGDILQIDRHIEEVPLEEPLDFQLTDVSYIDVPLMHFDTTWLGTFEGDGHVHFTSDDGLELYVPNVEKQLTVQIELDQSLHIELTSARKRITIENAILKMPQHLAPANIEHAVQKGDMLWVRI